MSLNVKRDIHMREYEKEGKSYVEIGGQEIHYDGVVKIYVNSVSGDWIIKSPYTHMSMISILKEVLKYIIKKTPQQTMYWS